MRQKVSDYIADFLAEKEITEIFTVVGGGAMHLNNSFGHHPRLHCLYNHHEQASAMAAECYARVHGRIAEAFRRWDEAKDAAIAAVLADGRFTRAQLTAYLGSAVVWHLDAETLAGLRLFYRYAAEDGLIARTPAIELAAV